MDAVSVGWFEDPKPESLVFDVDETGFASATGCDNSLFGAGLGSAVLMDGSPGALLVIIIEVRHVPLQLLDDQLLNLSSPRFAPISATLSAPSFPASGM